jgi:acetoin utilization deacetylase AcuC-like enzyme
VEESVMTIALLYDPIFLEHDTGVHIEVAERLVVIRRAIESSGLLSTLKTPPVRAAALADVAAVHDTSYISLVEALAARGGGRLDSDTVVGPRSFSAAMMAAGATTGAVDAVLEGRVEQAFALVRPPGHHATPGRGMGFCLFNNVAIAVRYAQRKHGLRRLLVVDYDVHHGNGTQDAFFDDPEVLYFSTHEYPFYPGTGDYDEIGMGRGAGYTVNVPLPAGTDDAAYSRVFAELLVLVARRFQPELIVVSAGYDAHWMDPIGMMAMTVAGFGALAAMLRSLADELCNGRLVFALEGGYSLPVLGPAVVATLQALNGQPIDDPIGGPRRGTLVDIAPVISRVREIHDIQ